MKKYLSRNELAGFLTAEGYPVSAKTLAKYAVIGGGPLYRKFGNRCLTTPQEGLDWAESKLSEPLSNTSSRSAA
jgi:hypothetical protein